MSKSWKRQDVYNIEKHPFDALTFPGIKHLVIGTFPTHKNNFRYDFFYSGKENLFWEIVEEVFKHTFQFHSDKKAVDERQEFLRKIGIGITDMYEMCYRKSNYSTDENLFPIILTDIFSLLDKHSTIDRLILTSRTEVFGALGLLKTYFLQQHKDFPQMTKRPDKILEGQFTFKNRNIKIFVPYSPSPRLITENITTKNELVKMYKICLT
jgi:G:T/U-mismatch repair DNA glycosylase